MLVFDGGGWSCDLLEKSYFCSIANNKPPNPQICQKLWFAWKIVLLQYRKQHVNDWVNLQSSCDLLEKSYFCSIANNKVARARLYCIVVICLKNRTFAVSQTTPPTKLSTTAWLWFAWKIVLLQYRKQLFSRGVTILPVVICLKNRTFAVSQTTSAKRNIAYRLLWFAWKIVLLQYRKQPFHGSYRLESSCDLLEKSYFCSIANNIVFAVLFVLTVVICLKNRTFAVSQTTLT